MSLTPPLRAWLLGALFLSPLACSSQPMPTAPPAADAIALDRFMGAWHVIAHVPYFGERGHVASRDEYTLRADGKIDVHYVYQQGFAEPVKTLDSHATVKAESGGRRWTTWIFGVIPTKFNILEVAPDYSWALINYPGRDLAWVFARTAELSDGEYSKLLEKMRGYGVDTGKLLRVPQLKEQVGKPGFAAPKRP